MWPPRLHELRQRKHVTAANMTFVRSGMHSDTVGTRLARERGEVQHVRHAGTTGIAQQSDLVEVYA